jgi:membrane fusion protein (multidrug efflux system)
MVKEGDPLVIIDTAPYRAALAQANASLEQAEAAATNAKVAADRNRELANQNLVSRMQLDDALALERSTAAQVSAARAQVQTARINLGYATITSPISGRAGQMRVLEGALVGQGRGDAANYRRTGRSHFRVLRSAGIRLRAPDARAGFRAM